MPEKTTLRLDGVGLASPARDVMVSTAKSAGVDIAPNGVETFARIVTLTSAAAGTPVSIIADNEVGTGRKAYLTDAWVIVNGATAWTTGASTLTTVRIQDTNGTTVPFMTFTLASLGSNAQVFRHTSGATIQAAFGLQTGSTSGKGLVVTGLNGSNTPVNAGAGSDLVVVVFGYIG